jgi:Amt family ammonium transporter
MKQINHELALSRIDSGDTAWMLISVVLVMLMVLPGIALFYAGMVRRKNALSTVALVMGGAVVTTLVWAGWGYSLVFSPGDGGIGGLSRLWLEGLKPDGTHPLAPTVPETVFMLFQLGFAMVTVALVYGSVVERIRFPAAMVFALLWLTFVYAPVAHWVWHPNGWLHAMGHLDYAGGTVVHLASGVAGLVLAATIGQRSGFGREPMTPHNLMLTMIGTGLLWVGWFGFNGGSAMGSSTQAGMAVVVTQLGAAAGGIGWLACEMLRRGQISTLGMATGVVAGMVGVTPASGYVGVGAAVVIGMASAIASYIGVAALKARLGFDDALDVFGVHGIAGALGTLLTGVFFTQGRGVVAQVSIQAFGALTVALYVGLATAVIGLLIRVTIRLRVHPHDETHGLDMGQHGESLAG